MFSAILKAIFGTKSQRDVKKMMPLVRRINALEEEYQKLSDAELQAKTLEFKSRLAAGETLDDIMCEAFAVLKNACRRMVGKSFEVCGQIQTWDMIPFDVQLMGGIALHRGAIAEMATGEGKTLVATMPLYLNALTGKNCQHQVYHRPLRVFSYKRFRFLLAGFLMYSRLEWTCHSNKYVYIHRKHRRIFSPGRLTEFP